MGKKKVTQVIFTNKKDEIKFLDKKYHEFRNKMKKFGVRLLQDKHSFTDRLGNILDCGNMFCYVSNNKLNVGVFIGLVERYPSSLIYEAMRTYDYWKGAGILPQPTKQVAYAILDKKDRIKYVYRNIPASSLNDVIVENGYYQFNTFMVIPRPEFAAGQEGIGRCFALIDDLKDGFLKDVVFEDEDLSED